MCRVGHVPISALIWVDAEGNNCGVSALQGALCLFSKYNSDCPDHSFMNADADLGRPLPYMVYVNICAMHKYLNQQVMLNSCGLMFTRQRRCFAFGGHACNQSVDHLTLLIAHKTFKSAC